MKWLRYFRCIRFINVNVIRNATHLHDYWTDFNSVGVVFDVGRHKKTLSISVKSFCGRDRLQCNYLFELQKKKLLTNLIK